MATGELRSNKATVTDTSMQEAFKQGFAEGQVAVTMVWTYHVSFFFEGTKLREVQFGDVRQMLDEVSDHISNGPGTRVEIEVTGEPLRGGSQSVPNDDEVVDAEIVSGEQG